MKLEKISLLVIFFLIVALLFALAIKSDDFGGGGGPVKKTNATKNETKKVNTTQPVKKTPQKVNLTKQSPVLINESPKEAQTAFKPEHKNQITGKAVAGGFAWPKNAWPVIAFVAGIPIVLLALIKLRK